MKSIGKNRSVYLDYQASTPVSDRAIEAMLPFLQEQFANPHASQHAFGWKSAKAIEDARYKIAALIGADADEIVFTSGATESNNLAIQGLAKRAPKRRNRILVSSVEHKCVLAASRALEKDGFLVQLLPVNDNGVVDISELESTLG